LKVMKMKIVINSCYGGFGLSREAIDRYCTEKGIHPGKWNDTYSYYMEFSEDEIPRDDEVLVKIVEELSTNVNGIGGKADGRFSELKIVEVPDEVNWYIEEYDGKEWVAERHQTWD
jgi:hypothetical protein